MDTPSSLQASSAEPPVESGVADHNSGEETTQQVTGDDIAQQGQQHEYQQQQQEYYDASNATSNGLVGGETGGTAEHMHSNSTNHHHDIVDGLQTQFQSLQTEDDAHPADVLSENGEGGNDEEDPVKLFVGQIPKAMNEVDIFPTFDCFGPLKDVVIIRDKQTGHHRGCAFVTYVHAADAENAQQSLHDQFLFPGGKRPIQVKPADQSDPENKLFIGMLSRKATETDVRELFAPYGDIQEIYMIRNPDGTSKCAAFLRYMKRESALKAIENLHNNIVMDGSARPLIVKFADTKQQKQARHTRNIQREHMRSYMGNAGPGGYPAFQVPPSAMGMGPPPSGPPHQYTPMPVSGPPPPHHPYMYPPPPFGHPAAPHPPFPFQGGRDDMRAPDPRPREGPAGANLFIYHLPHDFTDADLASAFNPFGNVISAKVYVDRYTGESKGFGFVSYDSVISAESAIEQMNGFQIGNKRLKVQHKRVNSNGPSGQSPTNVHE
eukprot:CAMPEP_0195287648 /NCGR_PEP_ID=MMETSP0707-20130614/4623_1 /TAXON_ID=33640 /ORGANISM="Asterionellopsis glacialis, Strain CCMP134" /LENGTH=491 /DNA_ID=CAMNT_0040347423 /DNA_START=87 /DNA_END=1562 /DNA_ORIENTATION=+